MYKLKVFAKKSLSLVFLSALLFSFVSCSASDPLPSAGDLDNSAKKTPSNPDALTDLGVNYDGTTVSVKVWAPNAEKVYMFMYDNYTDGNKSYSSFLKLEKSSDSNEGGVWCGTLTGALNEYHKRFYTIRIDDTYILDPYARSMAPVSSVSTHKAAIINFDETNPSEGADPYKEYSATNSSQRPYPINNYSGREEAIIYEIHVRDFTSDPSLSLTNTMGTYEAFIEKLNHVRDLGVTHIQLLPVLSYKYGNELLSARAYESGEITGDNNYNWGYDPHNYFALEGMYSSDPEDPASRVAEFKKLVKAIHEAGMGVILDVVYNHTADTVDFADIAGSNYFYRNVGGSAKSGCGNDVETSNKMVRKLIVDSLTHWVKEYHVDGFRFDLMGIMDTKTITDGYNSANNAYQAIPGNGINNILFVGEGWKMWDGPSKDSQGNAIRGADQNWIKEDIVDFVSVFNDDYRDIFKGGGMSESHPGYIAGYSENGANILANIKGQPSNNFTCDEPGDSVNYLTAHDGLCLYDKMAYSSPGGTSDATLYKKLKISYAFLLTSQGVAFIHGGDEMGRSKEISNGSQGETESSNGRTFVRNSYDSTDQINKLNWSPMSSTSSNEYKLYKYVQGLIDLRQSTDAFTLGVKSIIDSDVTLLDSDSQSIAYKCVGTSNTYYIFVNLNSSAKTLSTGSNLAPATCIVDSDEAGTTAVVSPSGYSGLNSSSISVDANTVVIFRI